MLNTYQLLESEEEFIENQDNIFKLFFLKIEELFYIKIISFKHVIVSWEKEICSWIQIIKTNWKIDLNILKDTLIEEEDFMIINNKIILFLEKRKKENILIKIIKKVIEKIKYFFTS